MYIKKAWRKNNKNIQKLENRIMFKIKTRYYLELLTPETMKLFGNTQNKITKKENGENVPHLEITKVVNNSYQQSSRNLYTFVPNKSISQLLSIFLENFIFQKHLIQNFHILMFTDRHRLQKKF